MTATAWTDYGQTNGLRTIGQDHDNTISRVREVVYRRAFHWHVSRCSEQPDERGSYWTELASGSADTLPEARRDAGRAFRTALKGI